MSDQYFQNIRNFQFYFIINRCFYKFRIHVCLLHLIITPIFIYIKRKILILLNKIVLSIKKIIVWIRFSFPFSTFPSDTLSVSVSLDN